MAKIPHRLYLTEDQMPKQWYNPVSYTHLEGRILVRASGTEPLIRIMVEGRDLAEIEAIAKEIAAVIEG